MDNTNLSRSRGNNQDSKNYTREMYKQEIKKQKSEGILRRDRAENQNRIFNGYINVIRYTIEHLINDNQLREEYKTKLRVISEKYPAMFTSVKGNYPSLFGEIGPDQNMPRLGTSDLVEGLKEEPEQEPDRILRLFAGEGRAAREARLRIENDEITVRQAVTEIKDLFRNLRQDQIREQLTQLEKTLDTASTNEIRLGLSEGEMARMATYEDGFPPELKIKEKSIPWKIKYCEDWIEYYKQEKTKQNISLEQKNRANESLKALPQYKADLESLQQTLHDQYNKLWESVSKDVEERKKLMGLRTKLAIPAVSTELAEHADALEEIFDAKIAKMHEKLKIAAEDLGLEEYPVFYLQQQIRKTKFYSEHSSLMHIRQASSAFDCWFACTLMAAADKRKNILTIDTGMKLLEEAEKWYPDVSKVGLPMMYYPMLIKTLGHPIDYQFVPSKHYSSLTPHETQLYHSHMGHYPLDSIAAAELKKVIGKKDEEGNPITVIVALDRKRDENRHSHHVFNIDALEVREDGEEWIIFRDPLTIEASISTGRLLGEGESMRWKDFLEIWNGSAAIPILDK